MCFDPEARPPIAPIAGGALDAGETVLDRRRRQPLPGVPRPRRRADRRRDDHPARRARPPPYYEDLAQRFAEHGIDAVAIDYFGRTAGPEHRDGTTSITRRTSRRTTYRRAIGRHPRGGRVPPVDRRAAASRRSSASASASAAGSRSSARRSGSASPAHRVLRLARRPAPATTCPAPAEVADQMTAPVLGLFGGADQGCPRRSSRRSRRRSRRPASTTSSSPTRARRTRSSTDGPTSTPGRRSGHGPTRWLHPGATPA